MRETEHLLTAALMLCLIAGCAGGGQKQEENGKIAFVKEENGKIAFVKEGFHTDPAIQNVLNIYTMNIDGSAIQPKGSLPGYSSGNGLDLSFSPNGKKAAYTELVVEGGVCEGYDASGRACTSRSPLETHTVQINMSNMDGKPPILLLDLEPSSEELSSLSSWLTWAPDSEEIAFTFSDPSSYEGSTIYSVNAYGSGNRSTVANIEGFTSVKSLDWSPDGTELAFSAHNQEASEGLRDIYKIDVNSLKVTRLTNSPDYEDNPAWSPDGTEIAFTHTDAIEGEQGASQIYKMNADGLGQTSLTRDPAYYGNLTDPPVEPDWSTLYSPVWSPDGEKIAFLWGYRLKGRDTANSAIYAMEADGSDPALIKNFTGDDTSTFVPNLGWLPDH